jgi:hypothetical protein
MAAERSRRTESIWSQVRILLSRMLVPDGLSIEEAEARIQKALETIYSYGQTDGDHHKMWVIDQVVRALMGEDYEAWVAEYEGDPDDENNYYSWDEGTP